MLESNPTMKENFKLVLASASLRRQELLTLMGLPFEIRPGTYAEPKKGNEAVIDYVSALAAAKGQHVEAFDGEVLLSADTIVEVDGALLGKPANDDEAARTLNTLRGRAHTVYTALHLRDVSSGEVMRDVCITRVFMRDWSEEEQAAYISRGTYRDKAGGYAIQDDVFHPVERIEGCYANVMGLPLCLLHRLFEEKGLPLPDHLREACQVYTGEKCEFMPDSMKKANNQKS